MPNLYGDILSDIAAEITGSVGLAGSANIGEHVAMFEAIHGTAPDIAGKDIANPSGLILSGVMMMSHVGRADVAERTHKAWARTIEDGLHCVDIAGPATRQTLGCAAFADAVIARLGSEPQAITVPAYRADALRISTAKPIRLPAKKKEIVGVDVFVHWRGDDADVLAHLLSEADTNEVHLSMITNRGVKVWPGGFPETFKTDHWRCRFMTNGAGPIDHGGVVRLLGRVERSGLDFIKIENLCTFDGEPGYSLGQGQ